ncbi:MAG: hypothetical protein ACKO38_19510 [Planctomycetota bacterium]
MATDLSPATRIVSQITRTRRHIKVADLATRLLLGLLAAMLFLMAAVIIDHWVGDVGAFGRWTLLVTLIGGLFWYAARHVVLHALRAINPVYAARLIERAEPSLRNSLINYLMLRQQPVGVHESVLRTIEQRAAADVAHVDSANAVDFAPAIRLGYTLAALTVLLGAYKILSPKDPLPSVQRLLVPWADIARPARVRILEVLPGDTIVYLGETVTVTAQLAGLHASDTVELLYSTEDGQTTERRVTMTPAADSRLWSAKLPPENDGLRQSLTYRVEAGDALSSTFQLAATAAPRILVDRVEYDYPGYMKRPRRIVDRQGDLSGWEGTRVTLTAVANQPIRAAWIEFDPASDSGQPTPADRVLHLKVDGTTARQTVPLELAPDRTGPKYSSYIVRFETPSGKRSSTPILHRIEVIPDVPPEVEILSPAEAAVQIPADGELPLEIRAVDPDFGLAQLAIEARGQRPQSSFLHTIFSDPSGLIGPVQRRWIFVPGEHGLRAGDQLRIVVVARDNRPGQNLAEPKTTTIHLPSNPALGESRSRELTVEILPPEKPSKPDAKPNSPSNSQAESKQESKQESKEKSGQSGPDKTDQKPGGKPTSDDESAKPNPETPMPEENRPAEGKPTPNKQRQEPPQATEPENTKSPKSDGNSPENSDGKSESGDNSNQPKPSDGKQSGGKKSSGKKSEGKQSGGNQSGGEEAEGKQAGDEQASGGQADGKQTGGKQNGGQQAGGKQPGGKQSGVAPSTGEKAESGEPSGNAPAGDNQPDGQPSSNTGTGSKPASSKPTNGPKPGGQPQPGDEGVGEKPSDVPSGSTSPEGPSKPAEDDGEAFERTLEFLKKQAESGRDQSESPERLQSQGKPTDATAKDTRGGRPSQSELNNSRNPEIDQAAEGQQPGESPKKTPEEQPAKRPPLKTPGAAGQSGAGQASKDQAAPPAPKGSNRDRDKNMSPDNNAPTDAADPSAPPNSKRHSDSQGGADGDKSGGGKRGGGQGAKQAGNDTAGSSSAGDDGAGQAAEKGTGDTSGRAGDQARGTPSDQPRNPGDRTPPANPMSGSEKGSGTQTTQGNGKPGGSDTNAPTAGAEDAKPKPNNPDAPGNPTNPKAASATPSDDRSASKPDNGPDNGQPDPSLPTLGTRRDPPPGDERMTGGGGVAGDTPFSRKQPQGPVAEGDAANLDYANRATDLVLDYLKDQKDAPNQELLDRLGWSADDLRKFVNRWETLKRGANEPDPAARRELSDSLRSLGLRPAADRRRSVNAANDTLRGNRDAGGRSDPPAKYQERFNAYRRGAGQ